MSEGETHLFVKNQITQALADHPEVRELRQEHHFGSVQADLTFFLRDLEVAVEIQRSHVSWRNIVERTQAYHRLGIHVLWVLVDASSLLKGVPASVPTWQRCLHALYFGVVYSWIAGQVVQPFHLARCVNQRQQYYDMEKGRWHSPLLEYVRMPWLLQPVQITELHPVTRSAGVYGEYTLPEASLLTLRYEVLQEVREEAKAYLEYTRHHGSW